MDDYANLLHWILHHQIQAWERQKISYSEIKEMLTFINMQRKTLGLPSLHTV